MSIQKISYKHARHSHLVWFSFVANDPEPRRVIQPYQLRDTLAFTEILVALGPHRYQMWDLVMNVPAVDEGFTYGPKDLIVITTRPPLDDDRELVRKIVTRSEAPLEQALFAPLRSFFAYNSRTRIELTSSISTHLVPGKKDRQEIRFSEINEAVYRQMGADGALGVVKDSSLTAGYLVFIPEAWANGPSLLCLFGICGWETVNWATYLARQRAAWLRKVADGDKSCFYMAEWNVKPYPRTPRTSESNCSYFTPKSLALETVSDVVAPVYDHSR